MKTLKETGRKKSQTAGWGDGAVSKVFALQALEPEFNPPNPHIKSWLSRSAFVILGLDVTGRSLGISAEPA